MMQKIYLDFIDEPQDSPRRSQQGIYGSYYIGTEQKIKVLLLDTRYFKDWGVFTFFGKYMLG